MSGLPTLADLAGLLDAATEPLLLVTRAAGLVHANTTPGNLVQTGHLLRIQAGQVRINRAGEEKAFRDALAGLTDAVPAAVVSLCSRQGCPVAVLDLQLLPGGLIAVRVGNLLDWPVASPARLARVFGLTPGEAKVTAALLAGHSLPAIARLHGTSMETVRTQIKRVRGKTGARSQAQLVGILARAGAGSDGDGAA